MRVRTLAGSRPGVVFVGRPDGRRVAALDWGGPGSPLLLLHPNGFCAGLFDPIAQLLRSRFRAIGVDLLGHGASSPPSSATGWSFQTLADDVVAVLDALGIQQVGAVGVSLGGGVAALVDRARPGLLTGLLLVEPVAFEAVNDEPVPNHMSDAARRRRAVWPSTDVALRRYAQREPLCELAPEALAAYVRWGTRARDDGTVELCCSPEHEAAVFEISGTRRGAHQAWEHLPSLTARTELVVGSRSFLPQDLFASVALRLGTEARAVEGGHFLLHEDSARGAALIEELLAG